MCLHCLCFLEDFSLLYILNGYTVCMCGWERRWERSLVSEKIHCKSWQMIHSSQDYIITDKLRDVLRPNNFVDTTELILTVHLVKFLQFNFIRFWVDHLFFHVKMCCANGVLICKCNLKNTLNYASLQLNNLV